MICLICRQAEIGDGLASVNFVRGELKLVVNHVPARVCPGCGEAYVEEKIAVRLLQDADAMSASGTLDGVLDFDKKQPNDKIHP